VLSSSWPKLDEMLEKGMWNAQKIWSEKLKGRDHSKNLSVDDKVNIKK
jgi:hypothetical protein